MLRAGIVACLIVAFAASVGCRTDILGKGRRAPQGPVAPIDNPPGIELADIHDSDAREVDLVESVLTHRAMYRRYLRELRDYYDTHGYITKRDWAAFELEDVDQIKAFRYLLDAEVPTASLRPTESIAAADKLYARGLQLMQQAGHGIPVLYHERSMREALQVFVSLIEQYPTSDKIDDAAFYCGEIHKDYLKKQEPLAVRWYERAFTWDPSTPHPARFRAAVTYDYKLQNRKRALELYHAVLQRETADESNLAFATRRIGELTADPTSPPRAEPGASDR